MVLNEKRKHRLAACYAPCPQLRVSHPFAPQSDPVLFGLCFTHSEMLRTLPRIAPLVRDIDALNPGLAFFKSPREGGSEGAAGYQEVKLEATEQGYQVTVSHFLLRPELEEGQ